MAAAGQWFGWNGVVLLAASLIATCFWLLHRQLLAEGCDAATATVLVLVAMLACSMHWLARPLLFTHLLTVIFAWQLRWFQQGRVSARRLFVLLPPLMVLWANLHGAFPTGLVLIAMYAVGSAMDAWRQSVRGCKTQTARRAVGDLRRRLFGKPGRLAVARADCELPGIARAFNRDHRIRLAQFPHRGHARVSAIAVVAGGRVDHHPSKTECDGCPAHRRLGLFRAALGTQCAHFRAGRDPDTRTMVYGVHAGQSGLAVGSAIP